MKRRTLLKSLGAAIVAAPIAVVGATKPVEAAPIAPMPAPAPPLPDAFKLTDEMRAAWLSGFQPYFAPAKTTLPEMVKLGHRCYYGCRAETGFQIESLSDYVEVIGTDGTRRAMFVIAFDDRSKWGADSDMVARDIVDRLEGADRALHAIERGASSYSYAEVEKINAAYHRYGPGFSRLWVNTALVPPLVTARWSSSDVDLLVFSSPANGGKEVAVAVDVPPHVRLFPVVEEVTYSFAVAEIGPFNSPEQQRIFASNDMDAIREWIERRNRNMDITKGRYRPAIEAALLTLPDRPPREAPHPPTFYDTSLDRLPIAWRAGMQAPPIPARYARLHVRQG